MATGDLLDKLWAWEGYPPSSNPATNDTLAASDGLFRVADFIGSGGSADESRFWDWVIPDHYDGGGVDFEVHYFSGGTATGAVEWEGSVGKTVDGDGASTEGFGTVTSVADTPTGTGNQMHVTSKGSISHANAGSPAVGDPCRFKLSRDHDHAVNTDDAQLWVVLLYET